MIQTIAKLIAALFIFNAGISKVNTDQYETENGKLIPVDLTVVNKTSTSVHLTWKIQSTFSTQFQNQEMHIVRHRRCADCNEIFRFEYSPTKSHTVRNLDPNTCYEFAVQTLNNGCADLSEWTNSIRQTTGVQAHCPKHFIKIDGYDDGCFLYAMKQGNYDEANSFCKKWNAHLAILDSKEKNKAFKKYITEFLDTKQNWLIDGTDLTDGKIWTWKSSGKPFEYTNWGKLWDQPSGKEGCVVLYSPDKLDWHDITCNRNYSFLCEMP